MVRKTSVPITLASLLLCVAASAQESRPAKKCKPKDTSCAAPAATPPATSDKSLHDEFPFPTDDSKGGGKESTPAAPANGLPAMPTAPVPDPPSESEKPMNLPPDSSSSLPPGTSSSADDDSDVAPTTADPNAPVKSAPLKNYGAREDSTAVRARLDKTRVPDDLKVGRYYLKTGNAQGAYLRFKDATDIDAEDPESRFYLGEAAAKLNKNDEAIAAYRDYLKLDPDGDHDKAARKALAALGAKPQ